jgi:hypothetical protein
VLQLYDNHVYMVGGAGGTRNLPTRDTKDIYPVQSELVVAYKAGIKDLTNKLVPLIKVLGEAK